MSMIGRSREIKKHTWENDKTLSELYLMKPSYLLNSKKVELLT